ncbi:hypothetical protein [Clostridium disporicum]|uniref:hypothetical protein n=1 Tax=Clostridium disporicum TaxID=84024 RepID=UPI0034A22646
MILGDISQELKQVDIKMPIRVSDGTYIRKEFGSDRGDYHEMYLGFDMTNESEKTIKTVGELINLLEEAKKQGKMIGYKGGEYKIHDWTTVTIGSYGISGREIWDVVVKNGTFYLIVGEYKFVEEWHD